MGLVLDSRQHSGWAVLRAAGEVDLFTADTFAEAIRALLPPAPVPSPRGVVIDLLQVAFMDSTGLGVLVGGYQRAKRSGRALRLTGTSDQLQMMLSVTGLAAVLEVFPDVEAATA
ncbi:STAS domain-containing protein [Quadrisphaera setariae]|uniref:STAS domain-containing protein n=1 Tax=Quadrisphaera setariae TaxID=2593304 RepID=UPI0034E2CAF8